MPSASNGRLGQLGILAAPLVAIVAVRWLVGGPTPAPASQPGQMPPPGSGPSEVPIVQLSAAQRAALEWIRSDNTASPVCSPLDMSLWADTPDAPPVSPRAESRSLPVEEPLDPAVASLRVTAVLGRADAALVALNSKVFRVGDEPAPGWKIASIDIDGQSVQITSPDGAHVTVTRTSVTTDR